jgi:hypothetical protein
VESRAEFAATADAEICSANLAAASCVPVAYAERIASMLDINSSNDHQR